MKEEASKQKWKMFDNVEMPEELDEATPLFHKKINIVMDVVAPGETIKLNPNYLGKWIPPRLQQAIWDRNNESEQLNLKGKLHQQKDGKIGEKTVNKEVRHAKGKSLMVKAGNDTEYSGGIQLYREVMQYLGSR